MAPKSNAPTIPNNLPAPMPPTADPLAPMQLAPPNDSQLDNFFGNSNPADPFGQGPRRNGSLTSNFEDQDGDFILRRGGFPSDDPIARKSHIPTY